MTEPAATPIPIVSLQVGGVYKVETPNLIVGAYTGNVGTAPDGSQLPEFIGIRLKFDKRVLVDEEFGQAFARLGRIPPGTPIALTGPTGAPNESLRRSLGQYQRFLLKPRKK